MTRTNSKLEQARRDAYRARTQRQTPDPEPLDGDGRWDEDRDGPVDEEQVGAE